MTTYAEQYGNIEFVSTGHTNGSFSTEADALLINCTVDGKLTVGQAARFKVAFPQAAAHVERMGREGKISLGVPFCLKRGSKIDETHHRLFIFLPIRNTEEDSPNASMLIRCFQAIVKRAPDLGIRWIAMNKVGCGSSEKVQCLPWETICRIIQRQFNPTPLRVEVYIGAQDDVYLIDAPRNVVEATSMLGSNEIARMMATV